MNRCSFSVVLFLVVSGCGESAVAPTPDVALPLPGLDGFDARVEWDDELAVRVVRDPYQGIDWEQARLVPVQLHDHIGADTSRIRAYDKAGYGAIRMVDYSGVSWLPYARTRRLWPPQDFLTPSFVSSLENIEVFIPGAEEVGYGHVVSAFLTEFVVARRPWDLRLAGSYASTQEAIAVTQEYGGLAFLAHPWGPKENNAYLHGMDGLEIYSAYGAVKQREGRFDHVGGSLDAEAAMVAMWDHFLVRDQTIRGIAVNDHFGPDDTELRQDDGLKDSGKILVVAEYGELGDVRHALENGRFFAVRDQGRSKSAHLVVRSLRTDSLAIRLESEGDVSWMSGGRRIGSGPVLWLDSVPSSLRYARAEIHVGDSVVLYSQAFGLRPQRSPSRCLGGMRVSNTSLARCGPPTALD